jgi:hypothetical protein
MSPAIMMLSRELRRVPLDYKHPIENGRPTPLFLEFYEDALEQWVAQWREWQAGTHPDLQEGGLHGPDKPKPLYAAWDGDPPSCERYLQERWPEDVEMGVQMWETVSEGTPISAVYPDTTEGRRAMAEELVETSGNTILAHFTAGDWLEVMGQQVVGTDIPSGRPFKAKP